MVQKRESKMERIAKGERRVQLPGSVDRIASYRTVNSGVLIETIQMVSLAGGAIRFGFTRDGGAYAIGVYGDGDPYTVYCAPKDSLEDVLRAIIDGFNIIGNTAARGGD